MIRSVALVGEQVVEADLGAVRGAERRVGEPGAGAPLVQVKDRRRRIVEIDHGGAPQGGSSDGRDPHGPAPDEERRLPQRCRCLEERARIEIGIPRHAFHYHGAPLRVVGIQEPVHVTAAQDAGQLPGQVAGVLDPRIQSQATGGAVDVSGVTGQEDAAHPESRARPAMDVEAAGPDDLDGARPQQLCYTIIDLLLRDAVVPIRAPALDADEPPEKSERLVVAGSFSSRAERMP
jgi:hypothetical protein